MEEAELLEIEGLAMAGMVVDAKVEKLKGGSRLVIKTVDGRTIASRVDDPGVIAKSYFIVKKYMEWGRVINKGR